jgi:hypothetical protein
LVGHPLDSSDQVSEEIVPARSLGSPLNPEAPVHDGTTESCGFQKNAHRVFVVSEDNANLFNDTKTPVAMVSHAYRLVQHADILMAAKEFLIRMECPHTNPMTIRLSENGERMAAQMDLGERFAFQPDGHIVGLHLLCTNTVDGGGSMQASLAWFRVICSNGLKVRASMRTQM